MKVLGGVSNQGYMNVLVSYQTYIEDIMLVSDKSKKNFKGYLCYILEDVW